MFWTCGTLRKFHSVNFLTLADRTLPPVQLFFALPDRARSFIRRPAKKSPIKSRRCDRTDVFGVSALPRRERAKSRVVFFAPVRKLSRPRIKSGGCAFNGRWKQIPRRYFSFSSEKEQRATSLQSIYFYPSGCLQYRANVDRLLRLRQSEYKRGGDIAIKISSRVYKATGVRFLLLSRAPSCFSPFNFPPAKTYTPCSTVILFV